jgi:hypothetical protein
MSLIGGIASGSSPEVIPLRPNHDAASSVASTIVSANGPAPSVLSAWTFAASAVAFAPAPTTSRSILPFAPSCSSIPRSTAATLSCSSVSRSTAATLSCSSVSRSTVVALSCALIPRSAAATLSCALMPRFTVGIPWPAVLTPRRASARWRWRSGGA